MGEVAPSEEGELGVLIPPIYKAPDKAEIHKSHLGRCLSMVQTDVST